MMESAYFIVEAVKAKQDVKQVKKGLDKLHGVTSVAVDEKTNLIAVDYDSSGTSYDKIENSLNKMGFEIRADASEIHSR